MYRITIHWWQSDFLHATPHKLRATWVAQCPASDLDNELAAAQAYGELECDRGWIEYYITATPTKEHHP